MHNPFRSEAEMFRLVVTIGAALGLVIVVAVAASTTAGAILLAVEVALGLWVLFRGSRGSLPRTADVAPGRDGVHRVLVVANQTVGGRALLSDLRQRAGGREAQILVVVPALTTSALEHWTSDVDAAIRDARERLAVSLQAMEAAGLRASGRVGDHHEPSAAIEDALREFPADEVVISTHPPEKSRWLEHGVVERVRAEVPLPVTHVVVDLEAEGAGQTA